MLGQFQRVHLGLVFLVEVLLDVQDVLLEGLLLGKYPQIWVVNQITRLAVRKAVSLHEGRKRDVPVVLLLEQRLQVASGKFILQFL